MRRRPKHSWILLLALGLGLGACGSPPDDNTDPKPAMNPGALEKVFVVYDPAGGKVPFPNDVTQQAAANDTLVIPVTGPVDPTTLEVRVVALQGAGDVTRTEADFTTVYDPANLRLVLTPKVGFAAGTAYAVAVRDTLLDSHSFPVGESLLMDLLKTDVPFAQNPTLDEATKAKVAPLEPLRAALNNGTPAAGKPAVFNVLPSLGVTWKKSEYLLLWTFTRSGTGVARSYLPLNPSPTAPVMPLPNDLVWQGDGDAWVDLAPTPGFEGLSAAVEGFQLKGLSPNMFLTVPIAGTVDPNTLELRVLQVNPEKTVGVLREDAFQKIFDDGVLKLVPERPLVAGGKYLVAIRNTLKDGTGVRLASSVTMNALKSTRAFDAASPFAALEPYRNELNKAGGAFDAVAAMTGWTRADVLALWTFETADKTWDPQSPTDTTTPLPYAGFGAKRAGLWGLSRLWTANAVAWWSDTAGTVAAGPTALDPAAVMGAAPHASVGAVYYGTFQSPNLLTAGHTGTTVTFLVAVPAGSAPAGGWPVAVFQHGIPREKENAFGLANAWASVGVATVAIDLPYYGARKVEGKEFLGLDLVTSRLNFYQAAVDLWETLDLIEGGIDLSAATAGPELKQSGVRFAGHSFGSIVGSLFLSQDSRPEKILLSSPSSVLTATFDATRLQDIRDLISSPSRPRGSVPYYVFLNFAQWLLDPIDAAYSGIGANTPGELLTVFANGDPLVNNACTKTFLANLGDLDQTVVSVDLSGSTAPAAAPGEYWYGSDGSLVIHSFLLTPFFDADEDPYYQGYSQGVQLKAYGWAQAQAAAFFAPAGGNLVAAQN